MSVYKLKQHVTEEELQDVGFVIHKAGLYYSHRCAIKDIDKDEIYIPLEDSQYGDRVIQYGMVDTRPEEMLAEDIEDLIEKGWVEEDEEC